MADVIRLLPEQLVNQIAAGEVIERPASALKELLENAIDAGATRISIELERGGLSSLIVTDNGRGMSRDELPVAVQRHATSKLPDDDLFQITHFGFRAKRCPLSEPSPRCRLHRGWVMLNMDGDLILFMAMLVYRALLLVQLGLALKLGTCLGLFQRG